MTETSPGVVGLQRATEMFVAAQPVLGPQALEIGLRDRLAEPERLLAAVREPSDPTFPGRWVRRSAHLTHTVG